MLACANQIRDLEDFRKEFNRGPIRQPVPGVREPRFKWLRTGLRLGVPLAALAAVLAIVIVSRREPTLVALNDGGGRLTLSASGRVGGIEHVPDGYKAAIRAALQSQQLQTPNELSSLMGRGSILRGTGPDRTFPLLSPKGTIVETDRPHFRWGPLAGAEFYQAKVYGADGSIVGASKRLTELEWTPESPLPRGVRLSWQVRAHKDGHEVLAPPLKRMSLVRDSHESTRCRAGRCAPTVPRLSLAAWADLL